MSAQQKKAAKRPEDPKGKSAAVPAQHSTEEPAAKPKPELKEQKTLVKQVEVAEVLPTGLKMAITEDLVRRTWSD